MNNQNNNSSNNINKEQYTKAKKAIFCLDLSYFELSVDDTEEIERLTNKIMPYTIKKELKIIKYLNFNMAKSIIDYSNNFYEIIKFIEEQKEPIALLINCKYDLRIVPPIFYKIKELIERKKLELHCYQYFFSNFFVVDDLENLPAQDKEEWDLFIDDTIKYFSYRLNIPIPSLDDWIKKIQYCSKFEQSYKKDLNKFGRYEATNIPQAKKAILFSDVYYYFSYSKSKEEYIKALEEHIEALRQEKEKYYTEKGFEIIGFVAVRFCDVDYEFKLLEVIDFIKNQNEPIALLINANYYHRLDNRVFGSLIKLIKSKKLELYFNIDESNNESIFPIPHCFYDAESNILNGFTI